MSKVAVMIPTRLKSTRLPNKPLALVNGKTVIQHVYEHALTVHPAEDVYIASGDQEIIDEAKKLGADAVLSVTPYYNKTSQTGLIRHFNTIANAVDIPMILYNVPSRTGCCIKPETYAELCKNPNIVATKEAGDKIGEAAKTMALCGDNLDVYTGCDDMTVPVMSLGGKGVISVFSNVMPKEMHEIAALCLEGNFREAAKMHLHYLELMNALFCDVNPIPVKEAMNMMGFSCGACRLPLAPLGEKSYDYLKSVMIKYGLFKEKV